MLGFLPFILKDVHAPPSMIEKVIKGISHYLNHLLNDDVSGANGQENERGLRPHLVPPAHPESKLLEGRPTTNADRQSASFQLHMIQGVSRKSKSLLPATLSLLSISCLCFNYFVFGAAERKDSERR